MTFRGSGYRAGRIAIYDNCCSIDTEWCRCAHGSCYANDTDYVLIHEEFVAMAVRVL
jgi:hypothetical protein